MFLGVLNKIVLWDLSSTRIPQMEAAEVPGKGILGE
jgi:hypothetical protein